MADNIDLTVIAPTLPPGSCVDPSIIQLMKQIRVLFPSDYSLFVTGPNEPSVEERDYIWVKTNSVTNEIIGSFSWSPLYGMWLKPHWISGVPSLERRIWTGTLAALLTYEGGESATVTDTTGPFWEVATNPTTGSVQTDLAGSMWIKPTGRVYDRSN